MISVVIPNYNRKDSVLRLLESVYQQEGEPFEVIVVDDNSSDGSADEIVARFPATRVLCEAVNRGPAACRSQGILHAKAAIVVGVDSDAAFPDRRTLAKVNEIFHENPRVDGLAFRIIKPDGVSDDVERWWHPLPVQRYCDKSFFTDYFSGTAYAFRRQAAIDARLFPEIFFILYEEVEFALRVLDNGGEILYCPDLIALHYAHPVSRRDKYELFYKPRNQILLTLGCFPVARGVVYLAPRLAKALLLSVARRNPRTLWSALVEAWRAAPQRWRERKPIRPSTWRRIAAMRRGAYVCPEEPRGIPVAA
jgi:GT2 family glycosyltransferase